MKKLKLIQQITDGGVVAVLRASSPEEAVEMADRSIAGGMRIIELTMTTPFALKAMETLAGKYSSADPSADNYAVVGVGTVLDPETARAAILSGAEFIVGPSLNPETVRLCNRYRVPVMPGVMTIQDIQSALELGVDIVKLFPGNLFSPSMISAIKGPLPQANVMPTGGVDLDNLGDWIKAGAVAVGIGSDLTKEAVKTGNFELITEKAAAYVDAFRKAKGQ
ncbi:bifunctional 4-hydroxy-2-oxoglutarate aldolase/2-dehydro-3-deoxy-phosphogluconate aldolase [Xylanibacillus composti]|uniref:Bifunctional 2-keto-4-hydroxyglutarate aldolase/2-keto-3-deoxy-6-phosphogluconate aldolase n=1 Tax=Xylanibacillus composti TaxID=1572762 RepID=A0A8J4M1Z7_9BACL|nr:bifunctional 2-keto-4-hydroxyglutarate aldolase/2-keto-3-deoxy-6-phosphogluconate aldolase [Xylanibacillus composti]MDT9725874.1 bifunctional 4-hydroxy-2-oxoglutarate aldolase/2-dehydro-3-deoxy-phosphogluconate aldolase [Xylanibacillus composti]GIQ69169.1 bifunctional 2-keto-4-hydroxyglutarate aldolase/2-keto-3-deoxy-6-phosphogluconate aldolase [Xylanibacillus composti]